MLVAGVPGAFLVRRAGRERVAAGGEADAAYYRRPGPRRAAGAARSGSTRSSWPRMATTEFAPPPGVRPEQGGIILTEDVRPEHKVAWLIQAAIDGAIDLRRRATAP